MSSGGFSEHRENGERLLVFGTGAMGSLFAAGLTLQGGHDVTVTGSWTASLDAIERHGLLVEDRDGPRTARPAVLSLDRLTPDFDVVLILTKSRQTAAIAGRAAAALSPGGVILTLQNGLGNSEILTQAAGPQRVAAGVTSIGASLTAPGRVRLGGHGRTVIGGREIEPRRLEHLSLILTRSGFPTEITVDLRRAVWTKLAVNCSINPISAISGLKNGELLDVEIWRDEIRAAAREVGQVAAARGITTREDLGDHALDVARATAGNRSSMLQDLRKGRPTEIDALCGAVVREADRLGVPVPVNARLADRVRSLEGRLRENAA